MSNNYASSETSALFPYNQTIVKPWGVGEGFSLKSDLIALDPRQKKVQGVILETKVDKNILPPMQVTIVLKILFLSIKLKVENIHVVHIDREVDGKSVTQKIFSTSARFFLEQSKYDYVNAGRQMDVSPRHSLNIKIDKDGKVKVENLFRKVVVGIFIKISGIGYLREINSSITFWKAERSYAREVKKFQKNRKENEELNLSTPAWLYLMNICMKTALFMDNERLLSFSENNIQRLFASKMKEEFFGKIVVADAPVVKVESKPKLILVESSKYKYNYLPKDISIEELKIIEKYVFDTMTPRIIAGFAKHYDGKTFFYDPKTHGVDSGYSVVFPNGIKFNVSLDYTEFTLYHNDPIGYCNYKIVENYFRLLSVKENELKAAKAVDYAFYEKRRAAEWEIKNTMKPVKGLLPWEKWEKNGKKKTGNKIVDEELYNKYVEAKMRETENDNQVRFAGDYIATGFASSTEEAERNARNWTYENTSKSSLQHQRNENNNPKPERNWFGFEKTLNINPKPIYNNQTNYIGYSNPKPESSLLNSLVNLFNQKSWGEKSDAQPFTIYGDRNSEFNKGLQAYNDKVHDWDNRKDTTYYNGTIADRTREDLNNFEKSTREFQKRMDTSNREFERMKTQISNLPKFEPIKIDPIVVTPFKPIDIPKIDFKKFE